jgi:two-component sensor histidine kinase
MNLDDLYRLLKAGHVQAQGIVDTIQVPLVVLDQHLAVIHLNAAFLETFGVTRDDTIGVSFLQLGDGRWNNPELEVLLRKVIPKSSAIIGYEVVQDFPQIGQRTLLVSARRLANPQNNSQSILVTLEDVSNHRSRAVQQDIVVAEIRHRFRNFLALVGSLARQSTADGVTAAQYRDTLLGRIDALADAELAVFGHENVELQELLIRMMAPYGDGTQIEEGPLWPLEARQAASLSMLLHELATNGTKHGALSVEGGRVYLQSMIRAVNTPS